MPYKTDKLAIADPFLDRRTKMLPCQKEMAIYWFNAGKSIASIAKLFRVNKRLIQFLIYPERKKANLEHRQARGGTKQYYNREDHNQEMKEHRQYKHKILNDQQ